MGGEKMSMCSCRYKWNCMLTALILSLLAGIIVSFLQITGMITVTPVVLCTLLAIAVAILGILTIASAMQSRSGACEAQCTILNGILLGIWGTILFSAVLLVVGIVATSIISAILVGVLVFFFALSLTTLTCYIRCALNCSE